MQIEAVSIKNFRSIEHTALESCGRFNALVGRNNSGKSNVLNAMKAFFWVVDGRHLVRSKSKTGKELDFFDRRPESPIEISVIFSLDRGERERLRRAIIPGDLDVPGVDLVNDPAWRLEVQMRVMAGAPRIAFVSKVSLNRRDDGSEGEAGDMLLLEVPEDAAREIAEHAHNRAVDSANLTALKEGLDPGDWSSLPRRVPLAGDAVGDLSRTLWRRYKLDAIRAPLLKKLDELIGECLQEGVGAEDFKQRLDAVARAPRAEADEPSLKCKIRTLDGESELVPDYVAEILVMLSEVELTVLPERRDPIDQDDAAKLYRLYGTRREKKTLRRILGTISDVLGVEVDPCLAESTTENGKPVYELDVDDMVAQASGAGIRESLRIVLDNELEPSKVVLIEEPEIHLHPGLQKNLMRYLKRARSDCQVFISTHSSGFLDWSADARLYLVTRNDSTRVRLLDLDAELVSGLSELGMDAGSVAMYERLVLVQNPQDEHIIREFADTLGVNLSLACVGFLPLHGKDGTDFFASGKTLSYFDKNRVQACFVFCRDENHAGDLAELREKAESSGAEVIALKRSGMENYLLSPGAILGLVREKQAAVPPDERTALPSERELGEKIREIAMEMKQAVFAGNLAKRLLRPVFPDAGAFESNQGAGAAEAAIEQIRKMTRELEERKGEIEKVIREEESKLKDAWNRESPEFIVPGRLLLKRIFQDLGVDYNNGLGDGARLAALVAEDEIPREMEGFIRRIGKPAVGR